MLECESEAETFDVILETKLYGPVGAEQWSRYVKRLGADRCLQVSLPWAEVVEAIGALPERCQADPIVEDLLAYLGDLYWLAGFAGLRSEDFTSENPSAARARLSQLGADIVELERRAGSGAVAKRSLRGDPDIDFYLRDQFDLIGNTGIYFWGETLRVKLVVGAFQFYGDDELRKEIAGSSELDSPRAPSYWGLRRLLALNRDQVAAWVAQAGKQCDLRAQVIFRCHFGRFSSVYMDSKEWVIGSPEDWAEVDSAMRAGEPVSGVKYATQQSVSSLSRFLSGDAAQRAASDFAARMQARPTSRPTHHATLVLTAVVPAKELLSAKKPADQVQLVADRHSILADLLRRLSGLP